MPAGATASFEALLDSLTGGDSSQPADHGSQSSGGTAPARASRRSMSPPSQAPPPHAPKDADDLLDQLLDSLDINASEQVPAAAPVQSTNPRASLSQPARASVSSQPTNPRASMRQDAAATLSGVEDSLDSLLAALDPAHAAPQNTSARASVAATRPSVTSPVQHAPAADADFDTLLAQLGETATQPEPASRPVSHRQPQPDIATLRPSFAEKYYLPAPRNLAGSSNEIGMIGCASHFPSPCTQPSRTSALLMIGALNKGTQ